MKHKIEVIILGKKNITDLLCGDDHVLFTETKYKLKRSFFFFRGSTVLEELWPPHI
jgi:hypothetical protein